MAELDLDIETARLARAGVEKITSAGDHGAVRVTVEEVVAMAGAIRALVGHIARLESANDLLKQNIENASEDQV